MEKVRLSFQDRFLLAFEREDLPFNSNFYFESVVPFDVEKVKEVFFKYLSLEPQLHVTCSYKTGECVLGKFSDGILQKSFVEIDGEAAELEFIEKHYSFMEGPAVRLASLKKDQKYFLIFSFYHPFFDGHAQMNYMKDYFDIYHGKNYVPRTPGEMVYFRSYFRKAPISWYLNFFFSFLKPEKKKKKKIKISRLADRDPVSRRVSCKIMEFDRKSVDQSARKAKLSPTVFFSVCAVRAFDKIQTQRGESVNPIVVYIPKTLRAEVKSPRSFQNFIGFIWMKFSREDINRDNFTEFFRDFYKFRSTNDEIRKVLFIAGLITKLTSYKKLRAMLKKKEQRVHDSSILVSSGRTPNDVVFPEIFKQAKFYGRGTMHRSPGISLLVTSNSEKDFISLEFLEDAFEKKTIECFSELLTNEINHYKFDP